MFRNQKLRRRCAKTVDEETWLWKAMENAEIKYDVAADAQLSFDTTFLDLIPLFVILLVNISKLI